MTIASKAHTVSADGITAPLRHITFRRIWLASLLSNLGIPDPWRRRGFGHDANDVLGGQSRARADCADGAGHADLWGPGTFRHPAMIPL
jgi:hypothetical protein